MRSVGFLAVRTDSQVNAGVVVENSNQKAPDASNETMGIKRFNTDRIRRRMREQQVRDVASEGKMLSMAPVRMLSPPPPPPKRSLISHGKENDRSKIKSSKFKRPPLAISVTVSEDEQETEEANYDPAPVAANVRNRLEEVRQAGDHAFDSEEQSHEGSSQNVSVWAMMEHYGDPVPREEDGQKDKDGPPNSAKRNYPNSSVQWKEDENGELVQSCSFHIHEEFTVSSSIEVEDGFRDDQSTSNSKFSSLTSPAAHKRHVVFRTDSLAAGDSHTCPDLFTEYNTPVMVQQKSTDAVEMADEQLPSSPLSLLQASMAQSAQTTFELDHDIASENDPKFEFPVSLPSMDGIDLTQLSLGSLPLSETQDRGQEAANLVYDNELVNVCMSGDEDDERDLYLFRIEELENALQTQRSSTNEMQGRLRDRVVELEQALRVTAATPRGTVVQGNPISTLLDRNQTLVKEVRFADQTCVELSSKIAALQTENRNFQEQITVLEQTNDDLQGQITSRLSETKDAGNHQKGRIDDLEKELKLAKLDLEAKAVAEENLLGVIRDAIGDLQRKEEDAMAVSITSERESSGIDRSGSVDNSYSCSSRSLHGNLDTLHCLVSALVARAKKSLNCEHLDSEAGRLREDNEFLNHQLGSIKKELDESSMAFRRERERSEKLEQNLSKAVSVYDNSLKPLERRILDMKLSSRNNGIVSTTEANLLSIQREFAYIMATIDSIKINSASLLCGKELDVASASEFVQLVSAFRSTFARMAERYKQLEDHVGIIVEKSSCRLEEMNNTVTMLRGSLIFEPEAVSLRSDGGSKNRDKSDNVEVINATFQQKNGVDTDDELYTLMEEARHPTPIDIDLMSDLDDVSRLLSDDMTFESAVRSGSVFTATNNDKWKEPLEAAIRECQRVRERSLQLKERLEKQKFTIQNLEQENGRLTLSASRRNEEVHLVEKALEEAREEVARVQDAFDSLKDAKEADERFVTNLDREHKVIMQANQQLIKELADIREQETSLKKRLQQSESKIASLEHDLEEATQTCEVYKTRNDNLLAELATKEFQVSEKKAAEISEIRQALHTTQKELELQRRRHEEIISKVSEETNAKLKLQTVVAELQSQQKRLLSDVEDRDLESQYKREDMRKERADLKSRLKETENEASNLRASFSAFKETTQLEIEEKNALIATLESRDNELASIVDDLRENRQKIALLLEKHSPLRYSRRDDSGVSTQTSTLQELEIWSQILPSICEEISELHRTVLRLPDVEIELESLKDQLSDFEAKELEFAKQLEGEHIRNEKLFGLLRQAEQEMEQSTTQIQEMSDSLATLQHREAHANAQVEVLKVEANASRKHYENQRIENLEQMEMLKIKLSEKSCLLESKEMIVADVTAQLESLQVKFEDALISMKSKDTEQNVMSSTIESLEKKASKLRIYVKKLTRKCEEWEGCYDKQSMAIERLQEQNSRIREKAIHIAGKYRKLAGEVHNRKLLHKEDRAKWSNERSSLNQVHAQLEQELELITKELSLPHETVEY